jgi:hypothetical protein
MGKSIEKLVGVGGAAISPPTGPAHSLLEMADAPASGLVELLGAKNGFYAFESALHVYPLQRSGIELGLVEWNAPDLWTSEYQGMADGCFFFAEDIFGGQFCSRPDGIYSFDPETGALQQVSADIESWAQAILEDLEFLTGYPVAHAWQESNGALQAGARLVPRIPFVTGGKYEIANFYQLETVKAMRLRANLATQIRDLPDGADITWKITD